MITALFDTNIFDKFSVDSDACERLSILIEEEKIKVVIPKIVIDELGESPFAGIPPLFPVEEIPDGVAVAGLAVAGAATPGKGEEFKQHMGESKKAKDAVVADTAANHADMLVSEDNRCRSRLQAISKETQCLNYEEFRGLIFPA